MAEEYTLTPQISPFEYPRAYLYAQYAEHPQLSSFVRVCNAFKRTFAETFIKNLQKTLNLKITTPMSAYYMEHYFGLSPIPSPSSAEVQANVQYDRGDVKYDFPQRFKYDDLLSKDEEQSAYISASAWAMISIAMLNYSKPCYNLPLLFDIISAYADAMEESLGYDEAKISVSVENAITTITLPATDVWRAFVNIATYAPNIIGLPYGRCVKFAIVGEETNNA